MRSAGRAAALTAAALSGVAAVLAVLVVTRGEAWSLPAAESVSVDAGIGLVYAAVGAALVLARHGAPRLGAVMLLAGSASAATVLATAVAVVATAPTPGVQGAVWLQSWLWVPGTAPLLTLVPLLYPDGRLPSARWWPAAAAAVLGTVLASAGISLFPQPFQGRVELPPGFSHEPTARGLVLAGALLLVPAAMASLASLVVRARRSAGLRRRQVLVLLVAVAVLGGHTLLVGSLPAPWAALSQLVAVCLVPVAIGVAATRHRLYDLDIAVCRGLVALSLTLVLSGLFVTVLSLARPLLAGQDAVATALAAGVTGALVQPLAARLSRGVDRMFYGDRAEPAVILARMSARLGDGLDVHEVPGAVCETVVGSLRLGSARLLLAVDEPLLHDVAVPDGPAEVPRPRSSGAVPGEALDVVPGAEPGAEPGTVPDDEVPVVLRHRGEVVGTLLVTPRAGERTLHARDHDLLVALAGQVAPSVAALRLAAQLQRSREALVSAREEERRRLRRELHDGVGAALAGVRLQLDAARDLVADPAPARILDAAAAGVAEAVGDVRAVTDDLRPPALDELGLPDSLRALADRVATTGLRVHVETASLPPVPAATEVAAYRIASEALANTVRHSGASRVDVVLTASGEELRLTVADDGRGPGTGRAGGLGLPSMRQRADELGGRCRVRPGEAGGTVVEVVLPLVATPAAVAR